MSALKAHWLAFYRRPLVRALFGVYCVMMLIQFFAPVGLARLAPQLEQLGGTALNANALAALEQTVRFPSAWATIFGQINGIGGLLLMIAAATFIAGDFPTGVARGLLARDPRRWRYLSLRFLTLILAGATLVLVSIPLGLMCAFGASAMLGVGLPTTLGAPFAIATGLGIAWLGLWPYLALALAAGIVGRNTAAALTATLGFWLLEIGLGFVSLFEMLGALGERIYTFSLAQSVGAWTEAARQAFHVNFGRAFGQFGLVFPDLFRATVQIMLYTVLFYGIAAWNFQRRDVRG